MPEYSVVLSEYPQFRLVPSPSDQSTSLLFKRISKRVTSLETYADLNEAEKWTAGPDQHNGANMYGFAPKKTVNQPRLGNVHTCKTNLWIPSTTC